MTELSIIVVHWNVPELLDRCLDSIEADCSGSGLLVETIVIDNGSDSTEVLRRTLDRHPCAQAVLLSENRGYAAGCNAGINIAKGNALLLLNPDTELIAGATQTLWNTLHVAPHVGMAAPLLLNRDGSVQSAGYRFPGAMNVLLDLVPSHPRLVESSLNGRFSPGDGVSPYRIDYPLGAVMMVRRAAIDDVGPLDESFGMYCEEIDWAKRLAMRHWSVLLAPAARVAHLGGRSTGQRAADMRSMLWNSRARYFERWGTERQRRIISRLVPTLLRSRNVRVTSDERVMYEQIRTRFRSINPGNRS